WRPRIPFDAGCWLSVTIGASRRRGMYRQCCTFPTRMPGVRCRSRRERPMSAVVGAIEAARQWLHYRLTTLWALMQTYDAAGITRAVSEFATLGQAIPLQIGPPTLQWVY